MCPGAPGAVLPAKVLNGGGALSKARLGGRSSGGFSPSVKNAGLCSVLVMGAGPVVYFTTICSKREGRGGNSTRDCRESREVKGKQDLFQDLADINNLFIFSLKN